MSSRKEHVEQAAAAAHEQATESVQSVKDAHGRMVESVRSAREARERVAASAEASLRDAQAAVQDSSAAHPRSSAPQVPGKHLKKNGQFKAFWWRGILADSEPRLRIMAIVIIGITCVSFTLMTLGFIGIGVNGEHAAYLVFLLQPVALCSLLLGTRTGTLMGLFAGTVLYLHSIFMPLDYFETAYVTVSTSVIQMAVIAFMLGMLFAIALRGDASNVKRVVRITIICLVVSWIFSIGLLFNGLIASVYGLVASISENSNMTNDEMVQLTFEAVASTFGGYGELGLQAWLDGLLMALLCSVGDVLARKAVATRGKWSARTLFNVALVLVVFSVFMVISAVNFIIISHDNVKDARNTAMTEVNYLCVQMKSQSEELDNLTGRLNEDGFTLVSNSPIDQTEWNIEDVSSYLEFAFMSNMLKGYTEEDDGLVLIYDAEHNYVLASDADRIQQLDRLEERLNRNVIAGIDRSLANGTFEQVIYDDSNPIVFETNENGELQFDPAMLEEKADTDLAYVYARQTGDSNVAIIIPAKKVFEVRNAEMARTTTIVLLLLLTIFLLTRWLIGTVVTRRIDATNTVLARITGGDLDARVEPGETREFASLSNGINTTVVALKGWIAEAEERMDAELATAKTIQESALPQIFPPFPDILRFDVYASMNAAREVGGDFYDFFLIGDDSGPDAGKLGFVVADVSGKGVPAALFMMNAKALIRGYMESGVELGEAIENVNEKLCEGNETGMFVTAFVGILDYASNHVTYVNAGHNPPMLWQAGKWEWLREKSGLPLGLFDGMPYEAHEVDCQIGDEFLIYTDGVTEAMNEGDELYGEKRLEKVLAANYLLHPRELVDTVRRDVAKHVDGAVQSDDITILALEVGVPPEITATLTVPARVDELQRVTEFIHTELDRRLCPVRVQNQLDIAVEELFVNVASYAYPDATPENPGIVHVSYTYSTNPPSITVDIVDDGIPYDPLGKPDAVTPDDIMDVPIGGLGILMAKRSVDEMRYERIDKSNVTTFVKKW